MQALHTIKLTGMDIQYKSNIWTHLPMGKCIHMFDLLYLYKYIFAWYHQVSLQTEYTFCICTL